MMRNLLMLVLFICSSGAFAGEFIVILNKGSSIATVSSIELKRLYTGKITEISGKSVAAVNLALDNPAAIAFVKANLGMTIPEYKSFWLGEQVRGGGSPPSVQKTPEAMIAWVTQNSGAIGYVPAGTVVDAVKSIEVK